MTRNETTIYNKPINIYLLQYNGSELSARAVPSPDSGAYLANVMIMSDDGENDVYIILDKDDAQELAGEIFSAKQNHEYSNSKWYKTTLISGVTTESVIGINGSDKEVSVTLGDSGTIKIGNDVAPRFCDYIVSACDQASEIYECNKNLSKQMTKLKDHMKAGNVHSLYFDILDEVPEMYKNQENDVLRIYEITARDIDEKPLYSFLRIMHLTGVPMIDYRDRGKEFLGCPFVYSDKLMERGKKFVEKKKSGLHDYVDDKTSKKS